MRVYSIPNKMMKIFWIDSEVSEYFMRPGDTSSFIVSLCMCSLDFLRSGSNPFSGLVPAAAAELGIVWQIKSFQTSPVSCGGKSFPWHMAGWETAEPQTQSIMLPLTWDALVHTALEYICCQCRTDDQTIFFSHHSHPRQPEYYVNVYYMSK